MKTLLVLRHAKSSWRNSGLADFERPLNSRGKRASDLVGGFLGKKKSYPDLVLCSTATRARETIRIVLDAARLIVEVRYDERLYLASVDRLREIVSQAEEKANSLMLVGHNPGMEEFLYHLTGVMEDMPTATLANIALDVEQWSEVSGSTSGRLEWLVRPRKLESE